MGDVSVDPQELIQWSLSHLDYSFKDINLLQHALTHRSVAQDGLEGGVEGETPSFGEFAEPLQHNERLEFLGDAVLDLAISTLLYRRYPEAREGESTFWRASLVNTRALSLIGRELQLGDWLRLGRGEVMSGGREKSSILGNSLEAVLGAVFLDGGWVGVEAVVLRLFDSRLDRFSDNGWGKDFKTALQERLQGEGLSLPSYGLVVVSGAPHERQFSVECRVDERISGRGVGRTKRLAEQEAAREALMAMDHQNPREKRA